MTRRRTGSWMDRLVGERLSGRIRPFVQHEVDAGNRVEIPVQEAVVRPP